MESKQNYHSNKNRINQDKAIFFERRKDSRPRADLALKQPQGYQIINFNRQWIRNLYHRETFTYFGKILETLQGLF